MAGKISDSMRNGIEDLLEAVTRSDYRKIVDTMYLLGFIRKDFNRYLLLPAVEYFFGVLAADLKLDRESWLTIDLAPIKENLVEIIYTNPFQIPIEMDLHR